MSGESRDGATRAIRGASKAAAGISVVLSPIPLADELALVPVYLWLTLRIARARGKSSREVPWGPLAKVAVVGLVVRGAVDATVATIPGIAAVINASTAIALTQIYGSCADHICRGPTTRDALGWRDVLEALRARSALRSGSSGDEPKPHRPRGSGGKSDANASARTELDPSPTRR